MPQIDEVHQTMVWSSFERSVAAQLLEREQRMRYSRSTKDIYCECHQYLPSIAEFGFLSNVAIFQKVAALWLSVLKA